MLPESPALDVNGIHLAKLTNVYRIEESALVYFAFITCDQPEPILIIGTCFDDLTEGSVLHKWLKTMHGAMLGVEDEPFLKLKYIVGTYVNLTVGQFVYNGRIRYCVKDIVNLVRIPLHSSSDEYQIDPEFLGQTPY